MTIHNIPLTRSAAALLAAGQHLRRKDGGGADEVFEQLSTSSASTRLQS